MKVRLIGVILFLLGLLHLSHFFCKIINFYVNLRKLAIFVQMKSIQESHKEEIS
jgi:hypothetical protein